MNTIEIQYYKTAHAEFILGSYLDELCLLGFPLSKKCGENSRQSLASWIIGRFC